MIVGKPERKGQFGRFGRRWDDMKMDLNGL
jgi:hypothetical protein